MLANQGNFAHIDELVGGGYLFVRFLFLTYFPTVALPLTLVRMFVLITDIHPNKPLATSWRASEQRIEEDASRN